MKFRMRIEYFFLRKLERTKCNWAVLGEEQMSNG